jgi:hypothetical protein
VKVVPEEPVDARLAAQYQFATTTGEYYRWPTIVLCANCSGLGCELCSESEPKPGRLQRLLAAPRRKER